MKRTILSVALVLLSTLTMWAAVAPAAGETFSATTTEGYELNYTVNPGDTTVTLRGMNQYTQAPGEADLVIPPTVSKVNDFAVTSIDEWAFHDCTGFTGSLTIGNKVTSIGDLAFSGCSGFTGSLTIPNSVVNIGGSAFSNCSGFTGALTIPNSVVSIGGVAFNGCSGFTGTLTIGDKVESIEYGAFSGVDKISSITCTATTPPVLDEDAVFGYAKLNRQGVVLTVPELSAAAYKAAKGWKEFEFINQEPNQFTATTVDGHVLKYTILSEDDKTVKLLGFADAESKGSASLTIPSTVNSGTADYDVISIGNEAFYDCSGFTGALTIGDKVESIGSYAFVTRDVDDEDNMGFTGSLTIPNSVKNIGEGAFGNCIGFTGALTIPNSVTSIGEWAFAFCSGFTGTLTIPNSVVSIGEEAFVECTGFTGSLTIPNSVVSIGEGAFAYCSGFTGTLGIGNKVESIGYEAFYGVDKISSITCTATTPPVLDEDDVFYVKLNRQGVVLTVPASSVAAYKAAEGWMEFDFVNQEANQFTFTTVDGHVLTYNVLSEVDKTVKLVGFADAESQGSASLTIPSTVNNGTADYDVISIGYEAFYDCSGFTGALTIGDNVTSIGDWAFSNCSGFTGTLSIGNKVESIGRRAFGGCSGFTGALSIGNKVESIGGSAFDGCSGFTGSLTIPNSVVNIGGFAFAYCSGFTGALSIGNKVESIGDWAFDGCSGFTGSLTIPNSVVNIGGSAFSNCSGFTGTLSIGNKVESIGDYAFAYSSDITSVSMLVTTPPSVEEGAFSGLNGGNEVIVTVPDGSATVDKYGVVGSTWQGMTIAEGAPTGIANASIIPFTRIGRTLLFGTATPVAVYNMSGKMLYSGTTTSYELPSTAGVYIIRAATSSFKVMSDEL